MSELATRGVDIAQMVNQTLSMTIQAIRWTAEAIENAIKSTGRTKLWLSEDTGIPYSTLNRKLAGKGDFTFSELLLIAESLGVSPATFTPPEFARANGELEAAELAS